MTFPLTRKVQRVMPPVAAGVDLRTIASVANENETVTAIQYIPGSTQAGAATNSRTLNLYNRNATDGTGVVLVGYLALLAGVDLTDNVVKPITLNPPAANQLLTAGQVLEWESLHVGTGIPDPGGLLIITTVRT